MGFVGLLKFAFLCFDFLAWPIFALGCPLYASVRAIETNSNSDMRNSVAYWIIFSLVSLFELAFVRLIDWLPFWPYMKLLGIFWLVVPHFNGARYVYECLLRPCLSVNPQVVIKYLIKPKEHPSLSAESFLAVAERYVKENGSEGLEKLIDSKSKHTKLNIDVEEIKEVTNMEKEMTAVIQPKFIEHAIAKDDIKAVELTQKNLTAATNSVKPKVPNIAKENAKSWKIKEKNSATTTERVNCVDSNLTQIEKKTVGTGEIKEKMVAAASGENKVPEILASEKVQRAWTCALCQVKTTSKKDLDYHCQGKKHKSKCEELKASKQANKNKSYWAPKANDHEAKKPVSSDGPNQSNTKKQEGMVQRPNQCNTKKEEEMVQRNQTAEPCKPVVPKFQCSMSDCKFWYSMSDCESTKPTPIRFGTL
ncbi:HVA22-like protein [Actinidia chinensis var. chinensis]|uniref:HVA22-like protein n=1 Tax=Actinidia chinensis var. chinensis TaxID=1590841 RepID=A0A2R6Q5P9_ACTCC|nr:HVA22-like protein [Actinidia chinensis var. chinensis]